MRPRRTTWRQQRHREHASSKTPSKRWPGNFTTTHPLALRLCGLVVDRVVHLAGAEAYVKLIGVLLIVFGVVALALGGIRYTTREKVLDIGPVEATTEKHHEIPLSP